MRLSIFLLLFLQVFKQQIEYLFAVIHARPGFVTVIVRILYDRRIICL